MRTFVFALATAGLLGTSAMAAPKVVTSIKPVHSLVSAVMEGAGEPYLLVDGGSSPHDFSMKPSQAGRLEEADLLFWVGHEVEGFLEKPVESYNMGARAIDLIRVEGIETLSFREGPLFDEDHEDHDGHEDRDHDDHDHDKHGEHDEHDDHADHGDHDGHDDHAEHDEHEKHDDHDAHDHDGHHHDHSGVDGHIWLDPVNAKVMVSAIEKALSETDPDNAALYHANAEKTRARLDVLLGEVRTFLKPVHDRDFIVFHDAYHYFEHRFDIEAAGAITVSPETRSGAERIQKIRHTLEEAKVVCVFSEPQFEPRILDSLLSGTSIRKGVLDPLGSDIENGPELYFALIRQLSTNLKTCLAGA